MSLFFCQDAINLHRKVLRRSKYFETSPSVQNSANLKAFQLNQQRKNSVAATTVHDKWLRVFKYSMIFIKMSSF